MLNWCSLWAQTAKIVYFFFCRLGKRLRCFEVVLSVFSQSRAQTSFQHETWTSSGRLEFTSELLVLSYNPAPTSVRYLKSTLNTLALLLVSCGRLSGASQRICQILNLKIQCECAVRWGPLKGLVHPKINDWKSGEVLEFTKHFWGFTAKWRCSTLPNNWSSWGKKITIKQ